MQEIVGCKLQIVTTIDGMWRENLMEVIQHALLCNLRVKIADETYYLKLLALSANQHLDTSLKKVTVGPHWLAQVKKHKVYPNASQQFGSDGRNLARLSTKNTHGKLWNTGCIKIPM